MRPGHGDVEGSPDQLQIPGGVQCNAACWSGFAVLTRLLARSGDCLHGFRFQVDLTNQMVLSISDVHHVAVEHHALRSKESSLFERAVLGAVRSGTDCFYQLAVEFRYYNSVVI